MTTRTIETEGTGEHYGVSLGVDFGLKDFSVKLEGSLASSKWTRTSPGVELVDEADEAYFGASIGGGW